MQVWRFDSKLIDGKIHYSEGIYPYYPDQETIKPIKEALEINRIVIVSNHDVASPSKIYLSKDKDALQNFYDGSGEGWRERDDYIRSMAISQTKEQ